MGWRSNSYTQQRPVERQVVPTFDVEATSIQQASQLKEKNLSLILFASSILFIIFWILVNLSIDNAFHVDTIEQINWSKSFQWGYWKHPPFSTMLLIGLNRIIGIHVLNTVILDFLILSLTLFFVWKVSVLLLGDVWGGVSALLLSANYCFSIKAIVYNHNTALIFATSACIWSTLWTIKYGKSKSLAWILNGVLVGFAILTKYQAVVPLFGILIAMQANNYFDDKEIRKGSAIAACSVLITIMPHLLWIWNTHFLIIDNTVAHSIPSSLATRIVWFLRFIINQFKFYWVGIATILVGLLTGALRRKQLSPLNENIIVNDKEAIYWLLGLCGIPPLLSLVCLFGFGIYLQSHYGFSFFLYFPTLVCWVLKRFGLEIRIRRLLGIFGAVTIINASFFIGLSNKAHARENPSEIHVLHAKLLAEQSLQEWKKVTKSPLKYIKGDEYLGGIVSVYSGFNTLVTSGNFKRIPWVSIEQLTQAGYLDIEKTDGGRIIIKAIPPKLEHD